MTAVTVEHLTRRYGDRVILRGLNLRIARGEFVALLGESGCGKTTLLRAIAGLDRVDGGRIIGSGRPAVVFQEHRLLPWYTVWRNVALGLPEADGKRLAEIALGEVGLGDRQEEWPRNLSGGQAQRVALARALVQEPHLLLLDEPSLGLAPLVVQLIFDLIARIRGEGTAILLVEQNARAALKIADYGYVIEGGRIVLEGPAGDLSADERVQSAYLGGGAHRSA